MTQDETKVTVEICDVFGELDIYIDDAFTWSVYRIHDTVNITDWRGGITACTSDQHTAEKQRGLEVARKIQARAKTKMAHSHDPASTWVAILQEEVQNDHS